MVEIFLKCEAKVKIIATELPGCIGATVGGEPGTAPHHAVPDSGSTSPCCFSREQARGIDVKCCEIILCRFSLRPITESGANQHDSEEDQGSSRPVVKNMANTKILTELSDYLLNNCEEIIKQWLADVQRNPDISSSNRIDEAELTDHLPQVLENIADRLKDPQSHYDYVAVMHPGRSHGKFRWRQGYRLQEVIREAGVMRWILIRDCLDGFEGEAGPLDKETRETAEHIMHGAVEDLLADSAGQYLQEQENRLSHLNSQLADAVAELRQQKD